LPSEQPHSRPHLQAAPIPLAIGPLEHLVELRPLVPVPVLVPVRLAWVPHPMLDTAGFSLRRF
jgi:hypothetical protein